MKLDGASVIVTGGGSGLGEATARAMAAKGAKVGVLDVNRANAEKIAKEIGGLPLFANVASEEEAKAAIEAAGQAHGVVRILVNCAGIVAAITTVNKHGPYPLDVFKKIIEVNLVGTYNMIRLVADPLSKAEPVGEERGVIINTSSIAAFDGQVGQAAYSASKGGIASLTLPVARDLARFGIRVNTIAPGLFLTPMMKMLSKEAQQSLAAQVPFPPRLGDPSEYAQLALHIIENAMLNGETIRLDGAVRLAPR